MADYFDAILERPKLLALVTIFVGAVAIYRILFRASPLPDIPIVGAKPGEWFPLYRAGLRNSVDLKTAATEAHQYKDRACILPIGGAQNMVHLPHKETQWLADRPDSDVNNVAQIIDMLQLDYTLMDPDLAHKPAHIPLIVGILTRETGNLIPTLLDEIDWVTTETWGGNAQTWKDICVYDTMTRIVGQTANRAFVGLPYCRDPALLEAGILFAQAVPVSAYYLSFFPAAIRPLVAPIITLPNRIYTNRFFKIIKPEVKKRQSRLNGQNKTDAAGNPHDFLEWSAKQALTLQDPYYGTTNTLAGRILLSNFTSIHTTAFAITHAILDLASGTQQTIDELRKEITTVSNAHGGRWDKRSFADMPKLDSFLRESQRMNSATPTSVNRMVVNPAGITTPSGTHLKPGVIVCSPSYAVLHDDSIYPDAYKFKPFRFAEQRAAASENVQKARTAFPTTSPDYLNFGHGKHACPGRFFAATALRLMLAYMVMHYDFELQEKRAENLWFGNNIAPPLTATIKVRRRGAEL